MVSAVVPHFFDERLPNLEVVVSQLLNHGAQEVVIWNNGQKKVSVPDPRVFVVQSPRNVGCQGRFLAALMARGDYVFFQDNDVAVQSHTIANLLQWSEQFPASIVTLEARIAGPAESYSRWPKIYGHGLKEPRRADLSLGRGEMVPRKLLPRILQFFSFDETTRMDDIEFSAAAIRAQVPIWIVPARVSRSALSELSMRGVGMCLAGSEFNRGRTEAIQTILEAKRANR